MKWSELKWNHPGKSWSLSTLYQPNTHLLLCLFVSAAWDQYLSCDCQTLRILYFQEQIESRYGGRVKGKSTKSEVEKQTISLRTLSHTKHVSRTGTSTSQEILEIHQLPCFFVTSIRTLGRTASAVGVTVELCSRRASISQRSSLTPKRSCKVGSVWRVFLWTWQDSDFFSPFYFGVFSFWNMILYSYIHNRIRIDIKYTYNMINTLLLSSLQTFSVPAFYGAAFSAVYFCLTQQRRSTVNCQRLQIFIDSLLYGSQWQAQCACVGWETTSLQTSGAPLWEAASDVRP